MAIEYIKYVAIVEIKMDKGRVNEINSWNEHKDWEMTTSHPKDI